MATEVTAKLGLVISATDEASQIFQDFANKVMEVMTGIPETIQPTQDAMDGLGEAVTGISDTMVTAAASMEDSLKGVATSFTSTEEAAQEAAAPIQEAMSGMAEGVTNASETIEEDETNIREQIALTRSALRAWSEENSALFGDMSRSVGGFADVSTADMKRVYEAYNDAKVIILDDLSSITDMTDGPAIEAQNNWANTVVMTSTEIKNAIQAIITETGEYQNLLPLLTEENSKTWKNIYEDISGVNVTLAQTPKLENDVIESTSKLTESFGTMSKASSAMMAGTTLENIGTSITGFGARAVKAGADFEQSITNATAALNTRLSPAQQLTSDQIDAMSQKALTLGQAGFFSANELADAMAIMSKNGMDYGNVMGGAISAVQDLAGATGSSLTDTAKTMTDIFNEYGPEVKKFGNTTGEQFNKVADLVTGAMSNSSISMNDFLNAMKYVGPVAGGLGMSLTDVATGISLVGKAGVTGSSAGTYFRSMLSDLIPTTKTAEAEMEKLGLITKDGANQFLNADGTVKSLAQQHDVLTAALGKLSPAEQDAAMKIMFGKRSLNGMEAVLHTSKDALEDLSVVVDKNGTAHEVAAAKMDTTAGRLKILQSNFETLEKTIGIALLPVVEQLIKVVQSLIDWFNGLSDPMKDVIIGLTLLGGAMALFGGKMLVAYSQAQFFKIAIADLIKTKGEDAAASAAQTTATEAQTVATEEATVATEELAAAEGETLAAGAGEAVSAVAEVAEGTAALGAGAVAASGSVGILGTAIAALTSPIAMTVIPIVAWGVGLYEAYQHIPAFHDAINTMVNSFVTLGKEIKNAFWGHDYAQDVADATNKSVANVITMSNGVLTRLNELKIHGGAISKDTADVVIAASTSMYDQVVKKADDRYTQETNDANKLKQELPGLSEDTYKAMLATATKQKDDVTGQAKLMNQKVNDEVTAMKNAGINVTEDMKDKLIQNFKEMTQQAATVLSDGEQQQKAVLTILQADHGSVSKQIAQQTLQDAVNAKNGATKAENDKYTDIIKTITNNRDVLHTLTAAQAQDAIEQAKTQHDKTMDQINKTYDDTVTKLKIERPNLVTEMNLTTGAMLTPWQTFTSQIGTLLNNAWNSVSSWVTNTENAIKGVLGMTQTPVPNTSGGMAIARNAAGTDFFEGGATWVGEEGPELVQLPQGSKIIPSQTSRNQLINMGASGRPGNNTQTNNITINVNGVGKNGDQLGQDIAKQLRLQMAMVTS